MTNTTLVVAVVAVLATSAVQSSFLRQDIRTLAGTHEQQLTDAYYAGYERGTRDALRLGAPNPALEFACAAMWMNEQEGVIDVDRDRNQKTAGSY